MEFGEKVRNARTLKGISQSELAKMVGTTCRTIQNYENGGKLPKKRDTYARLAAALDVSEEVLLDDKGAFVLRAAEQFGDRAANQAWQLTNDLTGMMAGGDVAQEDMDSIMSAIQEAYWIAKINNRKYANKRYQPAAQ